MEPIPPQPIPEPEMASPFIGILIGLLPAIAPAQSAAPMVRGEVRFVADDVANGVPERYRLESHTFRYEQQLKYDLANSGVEVHDVRFPSAVSTPHTVNNTVHCELFVPKAANLAARVPAVLVLDILDGQGIVSRGEAMWLAQHGVAAMTVVMPYYGPRRPSTPAGIRLLTPDIDRSIANIRQTVLDCRRAAAWLADQPFTDTDRLGLIGTSLGSFMGGLTAAAEPRIKTVCLLLGGGGLVDAMYEHPKAAPFTQGLKLLGITKEQLRERIAPADPLTYADRLKAKRLLLIAASQDDIVPPSAMTRLWEATGKPKLIWYDATHVGSIVYFLPAMSEIITHLKRQPTGARP